MRGKLVDVIRVTGKRYSRLLLIQSAMSVNIEPVLHFLYSMDLIHVRNMQISHDSGIIEMDHPL